MQGGCRASRTTRAATRRSVRWQAKPAEAREDPKRMRTYAIDWALRSRQMCRPPRRPSSEENELRDGRACNRKPFPGAWPYSPRAQHKLSRYGERGQALNEFRAPNKRAPVSGKNRCWIVADQRGSAQETYPLQFGLRQLRFVFSGWNAGQTKKALRLLRGLAAVRAKRSRRR